MLVTSKEFEKIQNELKITFKHFCTLNLIFNENESDGYYYPQRRYARRESINLLNGITDDTPFCKFTPNLPQTSGLYLWVVDQEIVYIGKSVNLRKRFNSGYGNISPRNCYKGGQNTNIKMNRETLKYYKHGKNVDIYILETMDCDKLEKELIRMINPIHNVQLITVK